MLLVELVLDSNRFFILGVLFIHLYIIYIYIIYLIIIIVIIIMTPKLAEVFDTCTILRRDNIIKWGLHQMIEI